MQSRADIEYRLTERLRTLPAAALQLLAEDIALIRDRSRYKNLYGQGRNAETQTTKGWPDAYVAHSDLTVDGVEATRDRGSWTDHLADDIDKANSPDYPNLNGYLFVAGYPDHSPTSDQLGRWKKRFSELGIPEDRIDLLIGIGLVNELLQPQYARTLHSILGISPRPEIFELIRQESVPGQIEHPFEPKAAEYRNGFFHRPALADCVKRRLSEDGCALIFGRGASGKSVLARLVASEGEYRVLPSYYLDLKPFVGRVDDLRGKIDNVLVEFGGENVLFVLDNIHLEEEFAISVFHGWKEQARWLGTRLLLLGRETKRISGSVFDEAPIDPLILRAGAEDVRGVYRRLARRQLAAEHEPPEPPEGVLRSWVKTFGGDAEDSGYSVDLMAFSAAARNRITRLLQFDWELGVSHAQDEVRKRYLARLSDEERRNLLRLAALPEDVPLSSEALAHPYAPYDTCIKEGLVFETEHGEDRYVRYSLAHSALGKLLLAAARPQVDQAAECCAVARLSPFNGIYLARQLARDGERDLARTMLEIVADNPNWLKNHRTVQHLPSILNWSRGLDVDLLLARESVSVPMRKNLVAAALTTPLQFLVTFLKYARSRDSGLLSLHNALVEDLLDHSEEFVEDARKKTPLHFLVTFLKYARSRDSGLLSLHNALVEDLLDHSEEFVERARKQSPVGDLLNFLRYASSEESELSEFRRTLLADLVQHPEELANRAPGSPFSELVTFLTYVQSDVSGFPTADSQFAQNVVKSIDLEVWNRERLKEKPQQPAFMVNVARLFSQMRRPELVATPARVLIEAADPEAWDVPNIGIHHLSNTVRFSAGVKHDHFVRFLDNIITQEWLDRNYLQATQPGLAGSLLSLATHLPPEFHSRFINPRLKDRLNRDLKNMEPYGIDAWAVMFSLVGGAAALGATATCYEVTWPDRQTLARIIESRRPADNTFGVLQIQFWLGLREMARSHTGPVKVSPSEAKFILESWRKAEPATAFATACNASMIAWLERSEKSNWILERSETPIREDIIHRQAAE